jgi:hypothetical protein
MLDSYDNLTLKGLMAMEWIIKHTQAKYMLKVDEDVMINPFSWIRITEAHIRNNIRCSAIGKLAVQPYVQRTGKYNITKETYSLHIYPDFLSGPTYFLSRDAMVAILEISNHITERFRLEDVYFLGILGNQVGIKMMEFPDECFRTVPVSRRLDLLRRMGNDQLRKVLWFHKVSAQLVLYVWERLQRDVQGKRYATLLQARDHANSPTYIPRRWRLPSGTNLNYNCQPQPEQKLDIWL